MVLGVPKIFSYKWQIKAEFESLKTTTTVEQKNRSVNS